MIRNASHKLVDIEGTEELYNLLDDPYEYNNLLADELSADDVDGFFGFDRVASMLTRRYRLNDASADRGEMLDLWYSQVAQSE